MYAYRDCGVEDIETGTHSIPCQHPTPHNQKPLQGAIPKEHGMVTVANCGVDQHTVVIKRYHTFACAPAMQLSSIQAELKKTVRLAFRFQTLLSLASFQKSAFNSNGDNTC